MRNYNKTRFVILGFKRAEIRLNDENKTCLQNIERAFMDLWRSLSALLCR